MENCSVVEDFSSCDSESSCSSESPQRDLFRKNLFRGYGGFHDAMYSNRHSRHARHGCEPEFISSCTEGLEDRDRNHHEGRHHYLMHHKRRYGPDEHRDEGYYMHHGRGCGHNRDHEIVNNYSTEHGRRLDHHGHHERRHDRYVPYDRRHDSRMAYKRGHGHHLRHERRYGHHLHHGRERGDYLCHEREHGHHSRHEREHGHHLHHETKHGHHSHNENYKRNHDHHFPNERQHNEHVACRFPSCLDKESCREKNSNDEGSTKVYEPKSKVKVTNENAKFQICLDTSHYQPEQVKMRIVNGKIEVCAAHKSIGDDVYELHEMRRSFILPAGVDSEKVSSHLSAEGAFIIEETFDSNNKAETEKDVQIILPKE